MTEFPIKNLRRVDVQPGDRFLLRTETPITPEVAAHLQDAWRSWCHPLVVPLLVLPRGFSVEVFRNVKALDGQEEVFTKVVPHG